MDRTMPPTGLRVRPVASSCAVSRSRYRGHGGNGDATKRAADMIRGGLEPRDSDPRVGAFVKLAQRVAEHLERMIKPMEKVAPAKQVIFIGHGRSPAWRELKDFIKD